MNSSSLPDASWGYNDPGDHEPDPTPLELLEDFADMVETTIAPADPNEPPITENVALFGDATVRLNFLLQHGEAGLKEYYQRWPERKPGAEAVINKAREIAGCRGCGRKAWGHALAEGYCSQCWHHLGRKGVA